MDDAELIAKIRSGEIEAYADLVRKYEGRIRRLCASMLGVTEDGDDAAQEVFVKAYRSLHRFKGNASFYTWLYRIASNHTLDCIRKKSRRPEVSWEAFIEERGSEIEKLFSEAPRAGLARELVHEALSHLAAEYRLILVLREIEGLSYAEIAATLSCSLDAVKGRLKRARSEFKGKLRHFLRPRTV